MKITLGKWPRKRWYATQSPQLPHGVPEPGATWGRHSTLLTVGDWEVCWHQVHWGEDGKGHGHPPGSGSTELVVRDGATWDGESTLNTYSRDISIIWSPYYPSQGRVRVDPKFPSQNRKRWFGYTGRFDYDGSRTGFGLWPFRITWNTPYNRLHWQGTYEAEEEFWKTPPKDTWVDKALTWLPKF